MKKFLTYLTLIILTVMQTTLFPHLRIMGVIPNLVLVFVVCHSMYADPVPATVFAIAAGLIFDVYQASNIGFNSIMMMYVGLGLSCLTSGYVKSNIFTVLICVGVTTLLYEGIYAFLLYFIFGNVTAGTMWSVASFEALYNMAAAAALMWWAKYLGEDEVRSF